MRAIALAVAVVALMTAHAAADDWVAVKLRGTVLQLVAGQWMPLKRGDVVSDDRALRTLQSGHVEFRRDGETITMGPQTEIQIQDAANQRYTTVVQQAGEVSVEAEVRNVQHFEVQTPFMAAVVKGTRFTVRSGKDWSRVDVERGRVAVKSETTHSTTLLAKGQAATATTTTEMQVSGKGDLPPVIAANGTVVSGGKLPVLDEKDAAALAKELKKAAAKATGDEKKALEKAAKEAEKAAKEAEKAAKDQAKATKDATKAAEKTSEEAEKAAEKAQKKADKADKGSGKGKGSKGKE